MSIDDEDDRIFKALANRTRRSMLDLLKGEPQTTGTIAAAFPDLDRCTVMQHLKVLEGADLLVVERRGRERWNHLNALPIHDIHQRWIGPHAAAAAGRIAQLRDGLEER